MVKILHWLFFCLSECHHSYILTFSLMSFVGWFYHLAGTKRKCFALVKHRYEAGEAWSWSAAAAPCLSWSVYFWRREKAGGRRENGGRWFTGAVGLLAGTGSGPLQTLASPEDPAWPSHVGGPFAPARWEADTWGGGVWAVSTALGKCRVFWTRRSLSLEPLPAFKNAVALPMMKGGRSRPASRPVAVASAGGGAGQRCGALGGLPPLLSRLRGSGAASGPGAATSPLSRTVQTRGWHVCLHPSLREFFLVNGASFSSLPWPRAQRNDLLGCTWLVSLWTRGSHRSPSSVPVLPSRSSNSSSGPKAELYLPPLLSLLEDRLQRHGWGSGFVWTLPMSWVKQDGGEEARGLLLPQGFLPQREISTWIKLAFSAWRNHSLPSQVSDLCSCGLLHF